MSPVQVTPAKLPDEETIEISLESLIFWLKGSGPLVLRFSLFFATIGLIYAFNLNDEYKTSIRVMPELQATAGAAGNLGDLKSIAGLAGVNVDNLTKSEAIRPDLYPDIVQSIPFALYLLKQPIENNGKTYILQDYLITQATGSIKSRVTRSLFGWMNSSNRAATATTKITTGTYIQLSNQQAVLISQVFRRISALIDKKSGIITITAKMPDPLVAATTASYTLTYLTNYVTAYRTGKARQQVKFLVGQVASTQKRYQQTEYALSSYRDRNRNLFLNTARIEEQRLQADYLLAQGVYNDLSKQLEQAKIKVQEESPVFQTLEPAQVPLQKSEPNRIAIIIGFISAGIILGFAIFIIRIYLTKRLS